MSNDLVPSWHKRAAFIRVNWQEVGRKPWTAKLKCIDIGRNGCSKVLAAIGPDALTLHLGDNALAEPSNAVGVNIAVVRSQVDMIAVLSKHEKQLFNEAGIAPLANLASNPAFPKHCSMDNFIDHIENAGVKIHR